jgi:hypothetical protein
VARLTGSKKSTPKFSASLALATAMAEANQERQRRMAAAVEEYGIDEATGWSVDLNAGIVRFTFDDHVLVGHPQLVGSYAKVGKTWTWGWAAEQIPQSARELASSVLEFATTSGFDSLLAPTAVATPAQADGLAALAFARSNGTFLYRAFGAAADTYVSVSDVRVEPLPITE